MSSLCRKCGKQMPKDRKGHEQVCPKCLNQTRKNQEFVMGEMALRTEKPKSFTICDVTRDEYDDMMKARKDAYHKLLDELGIAVEKAKQNTLLYGTGHLKITKSGNTFKFECITPEFER